MSISYADLDFDPTVPPPTVDVRQLTALPRTKPQWTPILLDGLEELPDKPKAHPTWTRVSSAGHCSRQIALNALGVPATRPGSGADILITRIGEFIHELLQEYLLRNLEGFSLKAVDEFKVLYGTTTSGHLDLLVTYTDGTAIVVEIKSMGGKKFRRRIDRRWAKNPRNRTRWAPDGISSPNVFQLAVQICLTEAQEQVEVVEGWMVNVATEQLSIYEADDWDLPPLDRICHEYQYTGDDLDQLRHLGRWELWRHRALQTLVEEHGLLPKPMIPEEGPEAFVIDPIKSMYRPHPKGAPKWWFGCDYCEHQPLCPRLGMERATIDKALPAAIRGCVIDGLLPETAVDLFPTTTASTTKQGANTP